MVLALYAGTYAIVSILLGGGMAPFVANPVSALAFWVMTRWDRLRTSNEFSVEELRDLTRIDYRTVLYTVLAIFILLNLFGTVVAIAISNSDPKLAEEVYGQARANVEPLKGFWLFLFFLGPFLSYFLGGAFAAIRARKKKISIYRHAAVAAFAVITINIITATSVSYINHGVPIFSEDDDPATTALLFVITVLVPVFGAWAWTKVSPATMPQIDPEAHRALGDEILAREILRLRPKDANEIRPKSSKKVARALPTASKTDRAKQTKGK
jgi:hypothetical protein